MMQLNNYKEYQDLKRILNYSDIAFLEFNYREDSFSIDENFKQWFAYNQNDFLHISNFLELFYFDKRILIHDHIIQLKSGKVKESTFEIIQSLKNDMVKFEFQLFKFESHTEKIYLIIKLTKIGNSEVDKLKELIEECSLSFNTILNKTPLIIIRFAQDGKILLVNDSATSIFKRRKDYYNNLSLYDLVSSEAKQKLIHYIDTITPFTAPLESYELLNNREGDMKYLKWITVGVFDRNQVLLYCQSFGIDLTQQKIVEQNLLDHESKLKLLITNMPMGFAHHKIIVDDGGNPIDYRYINANNAFYEFTGFSEGLIGKTILEIQPNIEKEWIEWFGEVAINRQSKHLEHYSDALNRWYSVNVYSPEKGEFVTIFTDTTEIHLTQLKTQKNEELLRITLQSIGDGVIATDKNANITLINHTAQRILGWEKEELLGKPLSEVFKIYNNTTKEIVQSPVEFVLKTCKVVELANHTELIAKDGTIYQISDSAAPIVNENNEILGVVLVFRDVTEKYEREKIIKLNSEILRSVGERMYEAELIAGLGYWTYYCDSDEYDISDSLVKLLKTGTNRVDFSKFQTMFHPHDTELISSFQDHESLLGNWIHFRLLINNEVLFMRALTFKQNKTDNTIISYEGFLQDITKIAIINEEVEILRAALDNLQDEIYTLNEAGDFIYANNIAKYNFGLTENLNSKKVWDISSNCNSKKWENIWNESKLKKSLIFQSLHNSKAKGNYPVELNCQYIISNTGHEMLWIMSHDLSYKIKNEIRRKQIWKMAKIAFWEYSKDTGYYICDDEFVEMFGLQKDNRNQTGIPIEEFLEKFHPEDIEEFNKKRVEQINYGTGEYSIKYRIIVDGKIRHIESFINQEGNLKANNIVRFGMSIDITDRVQIEIEQRRNQQKLLLALSAGNISIYQYNVIENLILFDIETSQLLAMFTPEKLAKGFNFEEFCNVIHFDDLKQLKEKYNKILNLESNDAKLELRLRISGKYQWYELMAYLVEINSSNKPALIIGYIANINDRKKYEEELEQTKYFLESAQNVSLTGHWIYNRQTDSFVISNVIRKIFCLNDNDQLTLNSILTRCVKIDDKSKVINVARNIKNGVIGFGSNFLEFEISIRTNSGIKYLASKGNFIKDAHNNHNVIFGIIQDITSRKILEIELIDAKNKAVQSDKLKSAFLANMSHEIRTPLNAIVGFSNLITDIKDSHIRKKYSTIINKNNQLLLKLISDIIDISKIEAGLIKITEDLFDINELMHSLFMVYLNTIDESLISLELLNETSDCFIIKGDEERIRQILINILNNSIKYTKKGSIKFGYILQSKAIHFFVEDTGIGINDEHLVKIFDRFHQVDDMAQGTGLGLSICKAILTQMGGEIEVVSEPNKGSKFTFSIPYNRE